MSEKDKHEQGKECFLCSLDPKHPCHTAQLEGHLVVAQERQINGERVPVLVLDTGSQRVEVHLEHNYYRSLIKELALREGDSNYSSTHSLKVRIYHLPTPPVSIEYKGRNRDCYKGNSYTLAILEPDILLNITDLNQAQYCSRQYLLNRMIPSKTSPATIRGNLVHHSFKELLKEHDQGKFNAGETSSDNAMNGSVAPDDAPRRADETPLGVMQRHLEQALQLNSIEMALADVSVDAIREDVAPHLESLARWYESERNTLWDMPGAYSPDEQAAGGEQVSGNQVRAETFLLAPEIGLRGRLDLFWQQSGRQRLLELKTGGASGELPKTSHRWQVNGYHALLAVRRDSKMKKALATLLYSGTPGKAQAIGIPATIRDLQRVNETRNILILNRITSVPSAPPGPSRCSKCTMLEQCQTISALLQWQPPQTEMPIQQTQVATHDDVLFPVEKPADAEDAAHTEEQEASPPIAPPKKVLADKQEREFFQKYYRLLQIEGRAGEQQQALLWVTPMEERIERGTAIHGLELQSRPSMENDGWNLVFRCTNTSELREGDEILLSNGNPVTGEVVSGTIIAISTESLTVWAREIIAHPTLIDRYDNELVHVRTLQNLLRWHYAPAHLRDLVAGRVRPRFRGETVTWRSDFNTEQNLAIERALQMQDYLLIHGPPGTGKTSVIAEIVKRLREQGQRVMLAAFTNQAVDNMLKRLDKEGFHEYLRLGHERSVDPTVRTRLLKDLIATSMANITSEAEREQGQLPDAEIVNDILQHTPVVASTTATWSSDKYVPQTQGTAENAGLAFDVAIIDEAGQLTIPAILGVLRFAKRFILVGDEKQLPPLVLSKEAALAGLADSLFSFLKDLDDGYMKKHPLAVSACVPLRVQYRMNKWISHFSSTVFYDQRLVAHDSIANRRLVYPALKAGKEARRDEIAPVLKAIDPRYPLIFLDVRDREARSEGKTSDAEARLLREVVAALLARGILQKDIGIIAPYRAQVATIRRHLFSNDPGSQWQALPSNTPLSVDTVDRFQGGERMILLMSFATTHEPALESQRRDFLSNPQRLNVALTRAQRKLILVGNVPALEHLPTFSRLITYCRSMDTLITASEQSVQQVEAIIEN